MLARSYGPRLDHNQENPTLGPSHHTLHPTKTPARAGKGAAGPAPVTGGKGVGTAKAGRVLGAKDRNGGKRDGGDPAGLLFPSKPSTSQAGPSCQPSTSNAFRTPAPLRKLRASVELRTPAPGARPVNAGPPPMLLAEPEPEADAEADEEEKEEEEESDREVEYAGPSARDFDEPFIPDHPVQDYKNAGFGAAFGGMHLGGLADFGEWEREDAAARGSFRAELEEEVAKPSSLNSLGTSPSTQPMFPVPPKRRAPLSSKPSNSSLACPAPGSHKRTPSGMSTASALGSVRKAASTASSGASSLRRPLAPSSSSSSASSTKRPLPATSSLRAAGAARPASSSSLASSKPSLSASSFRKPAPPSTTPASTSAARPKPKPLALSRPASAASLRSTGTGARTPVPAPPMSARAEREEHDAQERALGAFGVVDTAGADLEMDLGFGDAAMENEGAPFVLDLKL
ncbi:hypothetical protein JCM10207_003718 [Rhodosporidiobolus poonsookiae]